MRKWRVLVVLASVLTTVVVSTLTTDLGQASAKTVKKAVAKNVVCPPGYFPAEDVTRIAADLDGDGFTDCVEMIVTSRATPGRETLRVRYSSGGSSQIALPYAWALDSMRTSEPKFIWLRDGSPYPNSPGQSPEPDVFRLVVLRGKRLTTVPDDDGVLVSAESAWFSCSANGDVLRHSAVRDPSRLRVWTQHFSTGGTRLQAEGSEVLSDAVPPPGDGCGVGPTNLASVFRPRPAKCASSAPLGIPSERVTVNGSAVDVAFPPSETAPRGQFTVNGKTYAEPGDHDVFVRFSDGRTVNLGVAAPFGATDIHAGVWGVPGNEKLVVRSTNEGSTSALKTRSFQLYSLVGCSSKRVVGPQQAAFTLQSTVGAFNRSLQQVEKGKQNWHCESDGTHIRSYQPNATSVFSISNDSLTFQTDEPGGTIADSSCASDSPRPSVEHGPVPRTVRPELVADYGPDAAAEVAEMNSIVARASQRCLSISEVRSSISERVIVTPQPDGVAAVISDLQTAGSRPITVLDSSIPSFVNQPVRSASRPTPIAPSPNPATLSWQTTGNGRVGTATVSVGPLLSGIAVTKTGTASLSAWNSERQSWDSVGSAPFDIRLPGEAQDPTACAATWSTGSTGYRTVFPVERPVPKGSILTYSFPFPDLRPGWYRLDVPFGVVTFEVK